MDIKERTLRILAIIKTKPDKYHNILDLPMHSGRVADSYFMSYLGILIQSILIVNESSMQITKQNYQEYENCVRVFRENGIAYNREMPKAIQSRFHDFLLLDLPISWINPFISEYQLKLFGNFLWMDKDTKEYISDFNDPRMLDRIRVVWEIPFEPFDIYPYRDDILERIGGTLHE